MILRLLRDNAFVNPVIRLFVLALTKISKRAQWIANRYRIYGTVDVKVEGVKFKIYSEGDDFIANDMYYGLDYEAEEFKLVKALTKRAKYFVDVGANTGVFSIFSSCANSDLHTLSFEPHPGNFKRFQKNIALNQASRIQGNQLAIGATERTISFTIPSDDSLTTISSANENFAKNFRAIPFKNIPVNQTTLDAFLGLYPIGSHDLIKIDVEYYEHDVLKGASNLLGTPGPLLLLEVLDYDRLVSQFPEMRGRIEKDHARQIEQLLSGYGYFAYQLLPEGVKLVSSVTEPHERRNFLFSTRYVPDRSIPFDQLADTFSSLH